AVHTIARREALAVLAQAAALVRTPGEPAKRGHEPRAERRGLRQIARAPRREQRVLRQLLRFVRITDDLARDAREPRGLLEEQARIERRGRGHGPPRERPRRAA